MKKLINLVLVVGWLGGWVVAVGLGAAPPARAAGGGCGFYASYLPLVGRGETMAQVNVIADIESVLQGANAPSQDAQIVEIFEESVTVRPVGSDEMRANVAIPGHIDKSKLARGQAVRLGMHQGQPILLAVLDNFDEDANYSGLGYKIPDPPRLIVTARVDGWHVSWTAQPGAQRYHLYRNDEMNETTPDDLGYFTGTAAVIPFEDPYIYFAIKAVGATSESELSDWCTDGAPPVDPAWVSHEYQLGGHLLRWSHPDINDVAEFVIYRNTAGEDAGAVEMIRTRDLSYVAPYTGDGDYFGAQAVDYAGNESAIVWTAQYDPTPNPPTGVMASVLNTQFLVSWDAPATGSPVKEYVVFSDDNAAGTSKTERWRGTVLKTSYLPYVGDNYFWVASVGYDNSESTHVDTGYVNQTRNTVQDRLAEYGGSTLTPLESLWWLKIADFESSENWTGPYAPALRSSTYAKEGQYAVQVEAQNGFILPTSHYYYTGVDYSGDGRFGDDDYLAITIYVQNQYRLGASGYVRLDFVNGEFGDGAYYYSWPGSVLVEGYNYLKIKKSDLLTSGSPDWSDVWRLYLSVVKTYTDPEGVVPIVYFDDFRVVKADPDDADTYNDTGQAWDFAAHTGSDVGEWHIYPGNRLGEPFKPFSLGQIKTAASPSIWKLAHKPLATTDIMTGTIQAGLYLKGSDGQGGLAFFIKDVAADSWDMYAVEADSAANTIKLVKWVAGARTEIASGAFTFAPNQILWLGADFRAYNSEGGRIKVFASLAEGNLIQASKMVISAQDTAIGASGSVGVLLQEANGRFVNFWAGSDEHAFAADWAGFAEIAGVAVTISDTEPVAPWPNMLWLDTGS